MPNAVHVYGQDAHHDPVIIVGTREGLLTLLDAVMDALLTRPKRPRLFFAADGEGYEIDISLVSDAQIDNYVSPYHAASAHDPAEDDSPRWPLKA